VTADATPWSSRSSRPSGLAEVLSTGIRLHPQNRRRNVIGAGPSGPLEADGSGAVQARRVLLRLQGSRREMARSGAGGVAFENRGPAHLDAVEWVPVLEPSLRAPEIERLGAGDQESAGGRRRAFKSNPDPSSSSPRTVELSSCCQHEADRLEFDKSKCARPFPGHRRAGTCRRSGRRWRAHPGPRLVVVALLEPAVEQFNSTIREQSAATWRPRLGIARPACARRTA